MELTQLFCEPLETRTLLASSDLNSTWEASENLAVLELQYSPTALAPTVLAPAVLELQYSPAVLAPAA